MVSAPNRTADAAIIEPVPHSKLSGSRRVSGKFEERVAPLGPFQATPPIVQRCLQDQTASPRTNYFLAAACKQSGTVIGEAILRVESVWHGRGEVGWGVALQYTGRGFGTEIGQAIVRLGFELGLHRLYAQCRVGNAASLRTMAKVGLTEEGTIRENVKARGEWWSSCQWSILRADIT